MFYSENLVQLKTKQISDLAILLKIHFQNTLSSEIKVQFA